MYDAFKNRNEMLYFAILYDVKEGRKETIKYKYFNEKDNPTLIKSEVYDTFLQIVTKQ
jgi:hypothetical protein